MIDGRRVLAVVPARGGSKGIPLKNLAEINGKSLIALVGEVIKQVPEIDLAVVSTDSDEIAKAATLAGMDVCHRPKWLSGDRVSDVLVLIHAVERVFPAPNIIVMLQPTSPSRTPQHVIDALRMLVDGRFDSVWTVSPTNLRYHPLKQLTVSNCHLEYYDQSGDKIIARQQLEQTYYRNGIVYAMTFNCLMEQYSIKGKRCGALILDGEHISIDTVEDLRRV